MWQLDESMGTHLVNTTDYPWGNLGIGNTGTGQPAGTQTRTETTAQSCVDECAKSTACIGATWMYADTQSNGRTNSTGSCMWYLASPVGSGIHTLYVKVLPMDYMSGASTKGQAAVSSGSYVRYSTVDANLGETISNVSASSKSLSACRVDCDNSVQCWGFYYNGNCVLRKGLEGEGHRSFVHVVHSPGAAGAPTIV